MRSTLQVGMLVEFASMDLALVLVKRVFPLGRLDVTSYGTAPIIERDLSRPCWKSVGRKYLTSCPAGIGKRSVRH